MGLGLWSLAARAWPDLAQQLWAAWTPAGLAAEGTAEGGWGSRSFWKGERERLILGTFANQCFTLASAQRTLPPPQDRTLMRSDWALATVLPAPAAAACISALPSLSQAYLCIFSVIKREFQRQHPQPGLDATIHPAPASPGHRPGCAWWTGEGSGLNPEPPGPAAQSLVASVVTF